MIVVRKEISWIQILPTGRKRKIKEQTRMELEFVKVENGIVHLYDGFLKRNILVSKEEFLENYYGLCKRGEDREEVNKKFSALI